MKKVITIQESRLIKKGVTKDGRPWEFWEILASDTSEWVTFHKELAQSIGESFEIISEPGRGSEPKITHYRLPGGDWKPSRPPADIKEINDKVDTLIKKVYLLEEKLKKMERPPAWHDADKPWNKPAAEDPNIEAQLASEKEVV